MISFVRAAIKNILNMPMVKKSVTHKLWLLFLVFCFNITVFSQNKPKKDSIVRIHRDQVGNACLSSSDFMNGAFKEDSLLYDFFVQIDNNKKFKYDSTSILLKLLNIAEGDSNKACFLPFLRMVDFEADEMYKYNCDLSGRTQFFTNYCLRTKIQFLVLFYLQFTVVDTLKLKRGVKISSISLRNKKKPKSTILTQDDYHNIYNIYRNWVVNANKHKVKKPLKHSDYEWVLKYKDYVQPSPR